MSLALLFAMTAAASAAHSFVNVDDSDLSSPRGPEIREKPPTTLTPGALTMPIAKGMDIQLLRGDHGGIAPAGGLSITVTYKDANGRERTERSTTDVEGRVSFPNCGASGSPVTLTAPLRGELFEVLNDSDEVYEVRFNARCAYRYELRFEEGSDGAQALGIWSIADLARRKLDDAVGLSFWKERLQFVWPASGDYYSFGQVHITRGDHWDVVGHELGHAIYHLARIGEFGGGPHKIDECYSKELAFSEGWASYFSAWLSLSLDDTDAKFEFMVPRRAPIRFENVPGDVCQGQTNEWRVTAFLWDLIDRNEDGERARESFARVWKALYESRVASAAQARDRLREAGIDGELLQLLWDLDFVVPPGR